MSAVAQSAAAVLALALTGRLVAAQLSRAGGRPPLRFLARIDLSDFVYAVLIVVCLGALVTLQLARTDWAPWLVVLLGLSLVLLWRDYKTLARRSADEAFYSHLLRKGRTGRSLTSDEEEYLFSVVRWLLDGATTYGLRNAAFFAVSGGSRNALAGTRSSTATFDVLRRAVDLGGERLGETLEGFYLACSPLADTSEITRAYLPRLRTRLSSPLLRLLDGPLSVGRGRREGVLGRIWRRANRAVLGTVMWSDPQSFRELTRNSYGGSMGSISVAYSLEHGWQQLEEPGRLEVAKFAFTVALEYSLVYLLCLTAVLDARTPPEADSVLVGLWCYAAALASGQDVTRIIGDPAIFDWMPIQSVARDLKYLLYSVERPEWHERKQLVEDPILGEAWNGTIARFMAAADWPEFSEATVPLVELDDMSIQMFDGDGLRKELLPLFDDREQSGDEGPERDA